MTEDAMTRLRPKLMNAVERNWNSGPDALISAILALPDLAALLVHPSVVPNGWRMVPVEPGDDAMKAGCAIPGVSLDTGRRMWSAMLAASPQPPVALSTPDTAALVEPIRWAYSSVTPEWDETEQVVAYSCMVHGVLKIDGHGVFQGEANDVLYPLAKAICAGMPHPTPAPSEVEASAGERERLARNIYGWTPRIRSFENAWLGDLADAYRHADEVLATLRSTPAASSADEGLIALAAEMERFGNRLVNSKSGIHANDAYAFATRMRALAAHRTETGK